MTGAWADPRVPQINAEICKYAVAIAPYDVGEDGLGVPNTLEQGSGTCIRIDGRFFVATAAHVVMEFPVRRYAVLTPTPRDAALKVIGGGRRGGGKRDAFDVAWLELGARAAAAANRHFLDIARLAPHTDGVGEDLCVYGAPVEMRRSGSTQAKELFTSVASFWPTRAMLAYEIGSVDQVHRIHLEWPRMVKGHNDEHYEYPEAPGISGGGIWSLNTRTLGDGWRADQMQLIGIEFAVQRANGHRYLIGQQIHVWLNMLAEDIPELAPTIRAQLGATLLSSPRS